MLSKHLATCYRLNTQSDNQFLKAVGLMSRVTLFHGEETKNQQRDFPRHHRVTGTSHFSFIT